MSAQLNPQDIYCNEERLYLDKRVLFWKKQSKLTNNIFAKYYRDRIAKVYQHTVPHSASILEVGIGTGDLIKQIPAQKKFGVDFIDLHVSLYSKIDKFVDFELAKAHSFETSGNQFNYVILSDLVNELWDVQSVFEHIRHKSNPDTRLVLNYYSNLWSLPLTIAKKIGLARKTLPQNWLTKEDIDNFLKISDFEMVRTWQEIIFPANIPIISSFLNRYLVKIFPFNHLGLTNFTVARPVNFKTIESPPSVSVIIAARNESGHIDELISRIPNMGSHTEIIFVEGNSSDDTYLAIERAISNFPSKNISLFKQTGKGKGDAVRLGFEKARGDILMILDADITVPPEDLPRFYSLIANNSADFVNGVRLVYPMEDKAMRFLNLLGNKFFTWAFSWLLSQPIRDTLCGTKVIRKKDYDLIARERKYFGDFDPFGDFDLLFGAAKLNLKILEVPIRYRARKYGETNISRWSHGWLLLKMVVFAAKKIKFI